MWHWILPWQSLYEVTSLSLGCSFASTKSVVRCVVLSGLLGDGGRGNMGNTFLLFFNIIIVKLDTVVSHLDSLVLVKMTSQTAVDDH